MNSEETKENELRKMSNEFRLSNEFRSEGGKNVHSLYICPRLERVLGQQSHISVKEFIPISSLRVYLESTRFTMVNNKSLYSMTWYFGELLNRYFYLKLIFNLDSQWPTPWTLLFLWHQIYYKVQKHRLKSGLAIGIWSGRLGSLVGMSPQPIFWYYLHINSVRIQLNWRMPSWGPENCWMGGGKSLHSHIGIDDWKLLVIALDLRLQSWKRLGPWTWGNFSVLKKSDNWGWVSGGTHCDGCYERCDHRDL